MTLQVTVNGKPRTVGDDATPSPMPLPAFLEANDVNPKLVAVAINGDVIPKHDYASAVIRDGDIVEIVRMVGGGASLCPAQHGHCPAEHGHFLAPSASAEAGQHRQ